jgi:hypothetical protein
MKRASIAAALLALAACLVLPLTVRAQREVTDVQTLSKSLCTPMPVCAIPERGSITCPGAGVEALSGLLPPWCPAGSRTSVRDRVLKMWVLQATDDRVAGSITMRLNMNLDTDTFSGHVWGSYLVDVPGRGSWEGMFEGKVNSASMWTYRVVAFGTGEFDGLQLRADGLWKSGVGDRLTGQISTTRP